MINPWTTVKIITDSGEIKEGIAPLIVSASRSTDIPTFHSKWFFNRLDKGYVVWKNPFNQSPQYVSFVNTRVIVFWTKNPAPIIRYLPKLDQQGINYYFQYTLNDYDNEKFEPNIPFLEKRINSFIQLSELIGKNKVVWRFDPLLLSKELSVRDLLKRIWHVGNRLIGHTNKLVFSFADISLYRKVQNNLTRDSKYYSKNDISQAEFRQEDKIEFAEGISKILFKWKKINPKFEISSCSEDIDLAKYNISHNKCIDDDLMIKLFPNDSILMDFLGVGQNLWGSNEKLKDKGQRKFCGCIVSKDIGSYDTCNHLCVYCYANTSPHAVKNNIKNLSENSESLLPITQKLEIV
jgi:DNA repair photolyase